MFEIATGEGIPLIPEDLPVGLGDFIKSCLNRDPL